MSVIGFIFSRNGRQLHIVHIYVVAAVANVLYFWDHFLTNFNSDVPFVYAPVQKCTTVSLSCNFNPVTNNP